MTQLAIAELEYARALTHVDTAVHQLKADALAGLVPALDDIIALAEFTATLTRRAVELHREFGTTWTEIGEQLGISKQAAQQRFGGI